MVFCDTKPHVKALIFQDVAIPRLLASISVCEFGFVSLMSSLCCPGDQSTVIHAGQREPALYVDTTLANDVSCAIVYVYAWKYLTENTLFVSESTCLQMLDRKR